MRGPQCALPHLAEHLREFQHARIAVQFFDTGQGAALVHHLLDLVVLFTEGGQLRQMRHTEDLVITSQLPQFLSDDGAHAPANALIDLVEDQAGDLVGTSQDVLERQHQARGLASRGDLDQRDAEVRLLRGQLDADRALLGGALHE